MSSYTLTRLAETVELYRPRFGSPEVKAALNARLDAVLTETTTENVAETLGGRPPAAYLSALLQEPLTTEELGE